jgi:predicted nucleic acid-binding Zn ribbon protein
MQPETNVRQDAPSRGGTVVPLFPPWSTGGRSTCPECGKLIQTRKPAVVCSARCRASSSRRRRVEAALAKLEACEAALKAALEVVRDLRAALVFRGTP